MITKYILTTLDKLQKGDIISWGNKSWDKSHRFCNYELLNGRICVTYSSFNYQGSIDKMYGTSFQWNDKSNPAEIQCYLVKMFFRSMSIKHKNKLYFLERDDSPDSRIYTTMSINPINIQEL